jgi:proteasome lid subunit RPN8/RPN11
MSGEAHPWITGDLVIEAAAMADIEAHALAEYPNECCGFASGPAADERLVTTSHREVNEADKYHARDPVTFPRTARTYFKINELRASRLFEKGEKEQTPIKVIYHSHCDAGAYFSAEDSYTFAAEGQLMWPCAFIVVSVMDGKVADRKLWVHEPGTDGFRASTLTVR